MNSSKERQQNSTGPSVVLCAPLRRGRLGQFNRIEVGRVGGQSADLGAHRLFGFVQAIDFLWLERLFITTTSPSCKTGTKCCRAHATNVRPLIAPAAHRGATNPVVRMPPRSESGATAATPLYRRELKFPVSLSGAVKTEVLTAFI